MPRPLAPRPPSPIHGQKRLLGLHDLDPRDLMVLRDLVRFGVMADDQIARRYAEPATALTRLPLLKDGGLVFRWREPLEGARVYSATSLGRHLAAVRAIDPLKSSEPHLAHDIAVVDLADCLLASDTTLQWRTEREVRPFLDQIAPPPQRLPGERSHRPDGLLVSAGERIAIELEHSDKYETRYIGISRWFAREWRLDRVRWYVDSPRIVTRLRQVNAQHGFDRDIQVEIEPFPIGVRVRARPGRYDP